jgi:hypothetical protein
MTVYSRAAWGARPARLGPGPLSAREVVGFVFHWPAMAKPVRGFKAVAAALRAWQDYHMDDHGWSDIAYQVAVDQDGNRWILRGLDTQSAANGDEDLNDELGAILLILAPGEEPSDAMIREVRRVVADHRRLFPNSDVLIGHNEVRPEGTACPGPIVQRHLEKGTFEPAAAPAPRDLLRIELQASIEATKAVKARAKSPRRPRIAFQANRALKSLRKARDINNDKA